MSTAGRTSSDRPPGIERPRRDWKGVEEVTGSSRRLRVIQWATGAVGTEMIDTILDHRPDLELVGARVYSDFQKWCRRRHIGRPEPDRRHRHDQCHRDSGDGRRHRVVRTVVHQPRRCVRAVGERKEGRDRIVSVPPLPHRRQRPSTAAGGLPQGRQHHPCQRPQPGQPVRCAAAGIVRD